MKNLKKTYSFIIFALLASLFIWFSSSGMKTGKLMYSNAQDTNNSVPPDTNTNTQDTTTTNPTLIDSTIIPMGDSTVVDNDMSLNIDETVSSMANERGFLKSGNNTIDENEIINDYNGNLQYSLPIYNMKGPGDMYFNVTLNYNGSINNKVFTSNLSYAISGLPLQQYNISAPGWILSVNGMAVQMFNFETNFFTFPPDQTQNPTIKNDKIRLLATGYQITDRLAVPDANHPDNLFIMMGDGSVLSLKNLSPYSQPNGDFGAPNYIGDYYANGKLSYIRAKAEFIEGSTMHPAYRNRRLSVMKGDGLTYEYEETKVSYVDFPIGVGNPEYRPQMFLLKQIKDAMGHTIYFTYSYNVSTYGTYFPVYGRPLLASINSSWHDINTNLYYGVNPMDSRIVQLKIYNATKGQFAIYFSNSYLNSDYSHRSYVTSMITPYGAQISFEHEPYFRTAQNIYNPNIVNGLMTLSFDELYSSSFERLTKVTNYNGGIREYTYNDNNTNISIDMNPPNPNKIMSSGNTYHGMGRDAFFVNMLSAKTTKDKNNNVICTENFTYTYDSHGRWGVVSNPIDTGDDYYTGRKVTAAYSPFNNYTSGIRNMTKLFRNYKLQLDGPYNFENIDWPSITKTIWEKYDSTGNPDDYYKKVEYQFDHELVSNVYFKGSFQETSITETLNGIAKQCTYSYTHDGSPLTDPEHNCDNPITLKKEYDPLFRRTETSYTPIYSSSSHYRDAAYYPDSASQVLETTYFYQISKPTKIEKFSPEGNKIYKETYDINTSNILSNDYGYIGQVTDKKVYDCTNESNYLETKTRYYHNDTTCKYLYTIENSKPSLEGNVKLAVDPKGNVTGYYYHPVIIKGNDHINVRGGEGDQGTGSEPNFTYYRVYNDHIDTTVDGWINLSYPTRIDYNVSSNNTLSRYYQYDPSGNVWKEVSPELYLTEYDFDGLNRINKLIMPYDFSLIKDTTLNFSDTSYTDTIMEVPSNAWGYLDLYNSTNYGLWNYDQAENDNSYAFNIVDTSSGGMPGDLQTTTSISAIMQFDKNSFKNLDSIEYAHLEFFPNSFYNSVNGVSSNSYRFYVTPYTDLKYCWDINLGTHLCHNPGNGIKITNYIKCDSNPVCTASCLYQYPGNYNIIDVKSLFIYNHNSLGYNIEGLGLSGKPNTGMIQNPSYRFLLYFDHCVNSPQGCFFGSQAWFRPKLKLKARYRRVAHHSFKINRSSTVEYSYYDPSCLTRVSYKMDNYNTKQVDYLFDEFYRLNMSKLYVGYFTYDSTQTYYNYLGEKAKTIDGRGNSTSYSYDQYGNLNRTDNADNSNALVSNTYQNGLTNYFGTVNGLVNKQVYTDETGRVFEKYFDVVGNLRREVKNISSITGGIIIDPDTNINQNSPVADIPLPTDYRYDSLYRVTDVITPGGKLIHYTYDAYGRQSSRTTADAGLTKYYYDKNGSLIYSQDANERAAAANYYTFRTYDGINRLLTSGEATFTISDPGIQYGDSPGDNPSAGDYLIVNVYDTLSTNSSPVTFTPPADYYNKHNITRGNLVAAAYRTRKADNWSYKYYRYDIRGRIIRMWNVIDGLGTKIFDYSYNSQNQQTALLYQGGNDDGKLFKNDYDTADRLSGVDLYVGFPPDSIEGTSDAPGAYYNLANYTYNENSQVLHSVLNNGSLDMHNDYNNRNWVQTTGCNTYPWILKNTLLYNPNGNIRYQVLNGSYQNQFQGQPELWNQYIYDKSNRLLKVSRFHYPDTATVETNSYDNDGNLLTLSRNFGTMDNFNYHYISGTNKVNRVSGDQDQYTYDANGNETSDALNQNYNFVYDNRNLLIEFKNSSSPNITFRTRYWYDEAGNRIRKLVEQGSGTGSTGGDEIDNWSTMLDEYYVRDVSGKEIAIYSGSTPLTIQQWNIWGLDNFGKINADGNKFFYLKDHLGSIHAVVDGNNNVVSAQDYDAWGQIMPERQYVQNTDQSIYKFTSKERDNESNYDYFGARYYDSRIARWGGVEPLQNKYPGTTPYSYVFDNPIQLFDANGEGPNGPDEPYMYDAGGGPEPLGPLGESESSIGRPVEGISETPSEIENAGIGNSEGSSGNIPKWVVEEIKGDANELGLGKFKGTDATQESAEQLGKALKEFTKDLPNEEIKYNEDLSRVKIGNIDKYGKEVRAGRDSKTGESFEHIDIERFATGKKYKNLKIKIYTNPLKF